MSHIDDNSLELYALGRVSQFEVVAIEEHLLVCPVCSERLTAVAGFALTLRTAARAITTELIATHQTQDGFVYLFVRRTEVSGWVATIRGETLGGGVTAKTRQEAIAQSIASFQEMFPEHICGRGCIPGPEPLN